MEPAPLDFDRFDTLTFDCYGTLIDWERGLLDALQSLIDKHGAQANDHELLELFHQYEAEVEAGEYAKYRDVLRRTLERIGDRYDVQFAPEEAAAFAGSVGDWPPFPDTVDALQRLGERYRLAIISNVDDDLFAETARHLEVEFDDVITGEQVRAYKPEPRPFEVAFERLDGPDGILHVAQSLYHDIVPANELGLPCVWVNRYGTDPDGKRHPEAQPDLTVQSLAELVNLIA